MRSEGIRGPWDWGGLVRLIMIHTTDTNSVLNVAKRVPDIVSPINNVIQRRRA